MIKAGVDTTIYDINIFNADAWNEVYDFVTKQFVQANFADLYASNLFSGFNFFQNGISWNGGALLTDGSISLTDASANTFIINKQTFDNIDASLNSIATSGGGGGGIIDPSNNYFINDGTGILDCESVATNSLNTLTLNCVSVAASQNISCSNNIVSGNITSANVTASNNITSANVTASVKLNTPEISTTSIKDVFYLSATYINSPSIVGVYGINGNNESGVTYYNPIPFFCSVRKLGSPFRNALNSAIIMPQFRARFFIYETDYVNNQNAVEITNTYTNYSPIPIFYAFSDATVLNINNPNQTFNFLDNIVAVRIYRNIMGVWTEIIVDGLS